MATMATIVQLCTEYIDSNSNDNNGNGGGRNAKKRRHARREFCARLHEEVDDIASVFQAIDQMVQLTNSSNMRKASVDELWRVIHGFIRTLPKLEAPVSYAEQAWVCDMEQRLQAFVWHALVKWTHTRVSTEQTTLSLSRLLSKGKPKDLVDHVRKFSLAASIDDEQAMAAAIRISRDKKMMKSTVDWMKMFPHLSEWFVRYSIGKNNTNAAKRVIRSMNMNIRDFPELVAKQKMGALIYCVKSDRAMEFGEIICGGNRRLRAFLVNKLFGRKKWSECAYFVRKFNMQKNRRYKQLLRTNTVDPMVPSPTQQPLYTTPVPIVFVDSAEAFSTTIAASSLRSATVVGLDTESMPSFTTDTGEEPNELSLLQVATRTSCVVFDVHRLSEIPEAMDVLCELFEKPQVVKLAFAWRGDWSSLKSCIRLRDCNNLCDIQNVYKRVVIPPSSSTNHTPESKSSSNSNNNNSKNAIGLSSLVKMCLGGQHLDKYWQVSNWDRRPLFSAQLAYAASDAYALIDVYDYINSLDVVIPPDCYRNYATNRDDGDGDDDDGSSSSDSDSSSSRSTAQRKRRRT